MDFYSQQLHLSYPSLQIIIIHCKHVWPSPSTLPWRSSSFTPDPGKAALPHTNTRYIFVIAVMAAVWIVLAQE